MDATNGLLPAGSSDDGPITGSVGNYLLTAACATLLKIVIHPSSYASLTRKMCLEIGQGELRRMRFQMLKQKRRHICNIILGGFPRLVATCRAYAQVRIGLRRCAKRPDHCRTCLAWLGGLAVLRRREAYAADLEILPPGEKTSFGPYGP